MIDAAKRANVLKKPCMLRQYDDMIDFGDLYDFLQAGANGSSKCWNCLDLPVLVPEVPSLVR